METDPLKWCDNGSSLIDWISALAEQAELPRDNFVDLRRSSAGFADASIVIRSGTKVPMRWKKDVETALTRNDAVDTVRVAPNRVTLRFSDHLITGLLERIPSRASSLFGLRGRLAGRAYLVDFCDPNATKALHVGHLRNLALGNALASLLRAAGGDVVTQSIICDIGRNVCEALAGYLQHGGGRTPQSAGEKPDFFVGRFYADYVTGTSRGFGESVGPDAPIARELVVTNDLADRMLRDWYAGDDEVRKKWKQLVSWVLEGHSSTLDRLGIRVDRSMFESQSFDAIPDWIASALTNGILKRLEDGAIAYPTDREEYRHLLLLRPDGFPTEHMRAIPLWTSLQDKGSRIEACIHVMGNEWLPSTVLRKDIMRRVGLCPLYDRYHMIGHGMVTFRGAKMKSSAGDVLLIDEMLDQLETNDVVTKLEARGENTIRTDTLSRTILLGCFLSSRPEDDIEFSWEWLTDAKRNPGMLLATAFGTALTAGRERRGTVAGCSDVRFATLQAERLNGFFERAVQSFQTFHLMRFFARLAQWYVDEKRDADTGYVMRHVLAAGLQAVGLLTPSGANFPGSSNQ